LLTEFKSQWVPSVVISTKNQDRISVPKCVNLWRDIHGPTAKHRNAKAD
jgi:hypothetical protein